MNRIQFAGASLLALAIATPSFAQGTAPAPQAAEAEDTSADIIVTASKRAQTLQDTPISVAVASAQQIEQSNIRDLIDLQTLVPSLKVGQLQSSANTNFIIRGFGNGANNAGIEPSVGVFIDGVYRSRSAAQIGDLPNIERVEVLRGPQSTLFGKNASAGIISIVTAEPKFEFGGQLEASYGNYNAVVVKGSVTGPISETLAVSLAGNYNRRDGYARYLNLNQQGNNRNRYGIRGQILWQPSSDFKLRIIGDYDKIDEVCCTVVNIFDGPTGGAIRALGGQINSNNRYSYDSYANIPSVNKIDNYGVSAQIDARVSDTLSLVSITAYRGVKIFTNQDSDFTSADLIGDNRANTKIDTFTQELRLLSDFDGPINFLFGGYYFNEKIKSSSQLLFGRDFRNYANLLSGGGYAAAEPTLRAVNGIAATVPAFGSQGLGVFENYDYSNESFSIFGNIDFEITDKLTLSGGANYTVDRKRVATNNSTTDTFSTIDLVQSAANAGIPGTIPAGTFPGQTAALFPRTTACPSPNTAPAGTCNPFLGLSALQFLPGFLNFPNAVESGRTKDDNLSYTVRLAYKFNRNISAYATYGTGFKATSFNLTRDSRPFASDFIPGSPFQVPAPGASAIRTAGLAVNNLTSGTRFAAPEKAQVYEIGLKGNWPGFGFNLAVFKQILKGFQSNVFVGTGFVLGNAPKQSTQGLEFDASLTPVRNLNFTFSMTYLDPKFDDFPAGTAFNPATRNTGPANLTGLRPSGQSEYSIAVGATYTAALSDSMKAIFHVDYDHSSAFFIAQGLTSEQAAGPAQGQLYKASPETLNASVTLAMMNGLELTAWGRNLTEPKFNPVIFPGVAQSGTLSGYPSPPKTYGVSARFKF
ncbi:TonB-dependent receptor [Sphingomonas sp. SUN039]|uniref:TonB-dependent receptor n=1 Tax=Sphingomonas sp. SUN039 TaxID=2937787 RepID=UPI0021644FBB|nr:TonB-dependent receptor [Sphingomonas sp. SUN039]UVO53469.1 TonB-dependent receptor [Sphingomonas sp. SUN039]